MSQNFYMRAVVILGCHVLGTVISDEGDWYAIKWTGVASDRERIGRDWNWFKREEFEVVP